jgi:hypothetical protein
MPVTAREHEETLRSLMERRTKALADPPILAFPSNLADAEHNTKKVRV